MGKKTEAQGLDRKTLLAFFAGALAIIFLAVVAFCITDVVKNIIEKPTQEENQAIYSQPKKIAPYLYEINYSDYEKDAEGVTYADAEAFGCSSVRNGNFYGRNFDYTVNDSPEFVVRVAAKEGRHASIGVATHHGMRDAKLEEGKYDEQLRLVPNFTLDGINDAGVIASINVVPGAEDVGDLTGTNPDGEDLPLATVVRFILDNAGSADEAIELLGKKNLFGTAVNGLYLHIMIADPGKTYIVEFINNKMVAEEKTSDEQIMTNFYHNLPELTEHASGIERYGILKENYGEGTSVAGMRDLMAKVKYSNLYEYAYEPVWYSDFLPQSLIKTDEEGWFEPYEEWFESVRKDYWNTITNNIRRPVNNLYWHTTHNSVYDIENKTLRLTVQEDYANYYDFAL